MASPTGIELIATINEELLKSAKLTGLWENKLRRIERGDFEAVAFIDELKTLVREIVINVLSDNSCRHINVEVSDGKKQPKAQKGNAGETKTSSPSKPRAPRIKSIEQIKCPKCGEGHLLKGRTAYGCSRYKEGCDMRLDFTQYPADLTPAKLSAAIKKNYKLS